MRLPAACLLLALAASAAPAAADDAYDACVAKGQTDADYRDCGNAWLERADAALNSAWRALRKDATSGTITLLLDEQRAWNAYKEKSCLFWASGEYGTIGSILNFTACRAGVIETRTAELDGYLDELKEH